MMAEGRLPPATVVADRYEIVRLIGTGGLAEVYEVRHVELGSLHALKLLTWSRQDLSERLLLEGRIQAQLAHPNLVRVTDVVRHEGQVALLMELIDGPSLDELTTECGALDLDRALDLFAALLGAVDHAHQAGVLHRDLKPANVLLSQAGGGWVPKVTDFGLAKVLENVGGTRTGLTMGTPGFMAPEQVRDATNVDRRTDVFALGCILFEMLSGRRAYQPSRPETDIVELTATIDRRPPRLDELVPTVPGFVASAVERATELEPDARYADCRAFAAALDLQGHPAFATLPSVVAVPLSLPTVSPPTGPTTAPRPPASTLGPTWQVPALLVVALGFGTVGLALVGAAVWLKLTLPWSPAAPDPLAAPPPYVVPATEAPAMVVEPAPDQAEVADAPEPPPVELPVPAALPRPAQEPDPEPEPEPPEALDDVAQVPLDVQAAAPPPPQAAEAVQVPVPEAVQIPALPTGAWSGLIDGDKRMTLQITRSGGGRLEAVRRIPVGTGNDRVITLRGTLDRGTGAVRLAATTGDATFEGTWDGRTLAGTYRAGRRQVQAWSLEYAP